jgi:hypothetical protein
VIAFPALTQALQDRRLRPSDYRVLGVALETLDFMEFRRLKGGWVARRVKMRPHHAASSLRRLATLGYLERGPLDGHTWTYRVRFSVTLHESGTIQAA